MYTAEELEAIQNKRFILLCQLVKGRRVSSPIYAIYDTDRNEWLKSIYIKTMIVNGKKVIRRYPLWSPNIEDSQIYIYTFKPLITGRVILNIKIRSSYYTYIMY